jgi:hypothetical protein
MHAIIFNCVAYERVSYYIVYDYTITLWFPCLDGLIQTRRNVARVKTRKAREITNTSDFARFS